LILSVLIAFWSYLLPLHTLIFAALTLVSADFVMGILAAKRRGEPITSKDMRRTR
jgi:hypothetical protein